MNSIDDVNASSVIIEKLIDSATPGFITEFAPEEAIQVGAFEEDALSENDATESVIDLIDSDKGNKHG